MILIDSKNRLTPLGDGPAALQDWHYSRSQTRVHLARCAGRHRRRRRWRLSGMSFGSRLEWERTRGHSTAWSKACSAARRESVSRL